MLACQYETIMNAINDGCVPRLCVHRVDKASIGAVTTSFNHKLHRLNWPAAGAAYDAVAVLLLSWRAT
jgi:hypothetical protein